MTIGMGSQRLAAGLLALSLAVPCAAAEPPFERLGPEHGLPHNTVNDIVEDADGFLWLATDGGLARYDGYGFATYRIPAAAGSNVMMGLLEDSARRLWIGTETGLWSFDRAAGAFVAARRASGEPLAGFTQALLEDSAGRLWAGVGGTIVRRDPGSSTYRPLDVAGAGFERVHRLAEDGAGGVWAVIGDAETLRSELLEIAAGDGTAVRRGAFTRPFDTVAWFDSGNRLWTSPLQPEAALDGLPHRTVELDGTYANDLVEAGDGTLWVGSAAGLYRLDAATGRARRVAFRDGPPSWQREQIRALASDRAGGLWVGTLGGLFHRDPHRKPFRHWRHDPKDPASLSADEVSAIVGGPDGTLWVGTFGGGLNRFEPASGRAERFRHDPADPGSLPGDRLWAAAVDAGGRLWTGAGVPAVLDSASGRFARRPLPIQDARGEPAVVASALRAGGDGRLWLGTLRRGLFVLEPAGRRWRHLPELHAYSLSVIEGGRLWIGQVGAVVELDTASLESERIPLATADGRPLGEIEVLDLAADAAGLWLGTTAGLGRFDRATRTVELPIAAGEFPGTVVFSIQPDAAGRLWLGTNQGLARFDPEAPSDRVRVYDQGDGLGNVEFNRHARHRAADGTVYLGGMTGLTAFHPREIRDNPHPPPVVLTAIDALGRDGESHLEPFGLDRLVLPPGTSAVTFSFTALGFTRAERNRYAYRLEGLDRDWIDGGRERSARYTNLPPGDYRFRVRAANSDGVWNEAGASLPVVVEPAFWQTAWFKALVAVLAAAALYLAYRLRVAHLLELERVRLRIAGDLHDELGSELSGIALASSRLARRDYLEAGDRRRLEEVEASTLGVAQSLRDIVWYVNPEHDNWAAIEARMRMVASNLLDGIEHRFESELGPEDGRIDMASRRELFLIFKELVHNAARHASASRVEIRLAVGDGAALLEVADDGVGFDPASATAGSGMGSLRRRAAKLGAELEIDSRPGGGTRARVEAKMT